MRYYFESVINLLITIHPGVNDWHGATLQSGFIQRVVNSETQKGVVTCYQLLVFSQSLFMYRDVA
jgi:hypothetical protein